MADILQCHHWFPCKMTSEKRAQKFYTNDSSLCGKFASANQKQYPDLDSDASSV